MNRVRIVTTVIGVLCLAVGALLGWAAATRSSGANTDVAAVADAVQADKAAASRAASEAEGWAHVANATYALAKYQNAEAQAARKQTRELAARAERAVARAEALAAQRAVNRTPPVVTPSAVTAPASMTARPAAAARPKLAVKPAATPKASDESCRRAAIYERTAANASLSRQAAYNAVKSGIAVNAHCSEPERGLIEGYLLAQRASAESALKIGDWQSDLSRSDRLLADCVRHPERYGTAGRGCRQRLTKNERIRRAVQHSNGPAPVRP
jgi:hypothetical protein